VASARVALRVAALARVRRAGVQEAQWAERYDLVDRAAITAKTLRAARLVLAYRKASALVKRGACMALLSARR
jgi:hypothetical protein